MSTTADRVVYRVLLIDGLRRPAHNRGRHHVEGIS